MGIRSKLTNNITNKVGNSLLNIEEIKEKVICQLHRKNLDNAEKELKL